jgi:hypothetical protein
MMVRFCAILLTVRFAVTLAVGVATADRDGPPRNVILVGWDGAQRNHIKECIAKGELPTLVALAKEGALVEIDVMRITDTKAGWTQILTGYNPELTGVFSNADFQPIPEGLTIFERLEKHFGSDSFATVAVIGKLGNVGCAGPKQQKLPANQQNLTGPNIIEVDGVKYRLVPGEPYYLTKNNMDVFVNGLEEDEVVGERAIEYLEEYKDVPFFFFVHFAQVDHKGHAFGENSKEVNDAYISADTWTGKIVEKLKELGLYDDTLIYITADHGFDEGKKTHKDAPYVFLATNDPKVMRSGERADITPTILDRFGLDLSKMDPPLDGHSLLRPCTPPLWGPIPNTIR